MLRSSLAWCLGQMRPSPIYRHQWNSLEPWRAPYNSRIFQNTLHHSMYKSMYKRLFRILYKALDSSHIFYHNVERCGLLQVFLDPSTLFPLVAKCRNLQKLPRLYISPWESSFEASCDNKFRIWHIPSHRSSHGNLLCLMWRDQEYNVIKISFN